MKRGRCEGGVSGKSAFWLYLLWLCLPGGWLPERWGSNNINLYCGIKIAHISFLAGTIETGFPLPRKTDWPSSCHG